MAKEATVHPITSKPETVEELKARVRSLREAARRAEEEANAIEQAKADLFAQAKQDSREAAVKAVTEYRSLASPEEFAQFRRDLGFGRKAGKRQSKPCETCGKSRHGKDSTCPGKKS